MRFALLSRARHPAYSGADVFGDYESIIADLGGAEDVRAAFEDFARSIESSESNVYGWLLNDVLSSITVWTRWSESFTPLMHGSLELMLLQNAVIRAGKLRTDGRTEALTKLANISVPELKLNIGQLVNIRRNDELFAEWRQSIEAALGHVSQISENDLDWQSHARGILRDGLATVEEKAKKSLKGSGFLPSVASGFKSFTFAGLGGVAGASIGGGSVVGALSGAALGKAAETIATLTASLRSRREHRAVLDIVMAVGGER
ncbi:hypothetical protein [Saccharothrix stipae]